jgi:hypothetical protein
MPAPLRLGIAGLGTVGVAVLRAAAATTAASISSIFAGTTIRWRWRPIPTSIWSSS